MTLPLERDQYRVVAIGKLHRVACQSVAANAPCQPRRAEDGGNVASTIASSTGSIGSDSRAVATSGLQIAEPPEGRAMFQGEPTLQIHPSGILREHEPLLHWRIGDSLDRGPYLSYIMFG